MYRYIQITLWSIWLKISRRRGIRPNTHRHIHLYSVRSYFCAERPSGWWRSMWRSPEEVNTHNYENPSHRCCGIWFWVPGAFFFFKGYIFYFNDWKPQQFDQRLAFPCWKDKLNSIWNNWNKWLMWLETAPRWRQWISIICNMCPSPLQLEIPWQMFLQPTMKNFKMVNLFTFFSSFVCNTKL